MKEYGEVIFVDQLKHCRVVANQIDKTRINWQKNSAWFADAQREQYSRYASIYAECREMYGDKIYGYYARRNRLRSEYTFKSRTTTGPGNLFTNESMAHLKGYKYSQTTNGEYGSVRPSELFFCF
ncbi:uncharacterized protein LOC6549580 [Drosophila erecta]|uniref:Uncharacterized protein n=1 Tax=Drosophila erecta TaxID=7220 RepID=B3NLE9_DROER|nr:uncharacterized protein LOC6549580 [Drosophila erecta]EDV54865.1 uncharacterized protein Dere_GG21075 [Drosophila erecta]